MLHFVKYALFASLTATLALAQFDSATVLGTVRDSAQASVGSASVTLTSVGTAIAVTQETDASGDFRFVNVRPGAYTIKVLKQGFSPTSAAQFTVTVGTRQRVDLTLQIASVSETVTITGEAKQLETDTSSRGHAMQATQIVNLPLNGRSYADLALLAPGVRRSTLNVTPDGGSLRDASYNINGMRSALNNFIIDGVDNNAYGTSNQGFSNQVVQLSPDAVQEFRIETSNFSAEFGRAGGGVINATVKSGTNGFHGAAWDFIRNTDLNAVGFFKPRENRKPTLQQNQFGAAIGGPIKRDKLFFFADYEGFRRVRRGLNLSTLPTMEQRTGVLGVPVFNPLTGESYTGTIPLAAMTPFARKVLADLPAVNRPGTANNYESLPRQTDQNDKGDIRIDYYASQKLSFFGRYSHRLANNFEPPAIPGPSGGNSNGFLRVLNYQTAFGATYVLSPRTVAEFRLGVSQTEGGKSPVFAGLPPASKAYGITGLPEDPRFAGGLYAQSVGGFTQFGQQSSNPQFQNPYVINPKFNMTFLLGRHSLKSGFEYQRLDTAIDDFNPKYGQDNYGSRFSIPVGTSSTNNLYNLADFMFGLRSRYALNNAVIVNYQQRMYFGYIQDDFKVNQKLTLNMGLRYEFGTPQWERDNILTNFDPATRTLVPSKSGSLFERSRVNPDRNNFAPRFGMAYNLTKKTVLRGGFGTSYIHFNRLGGENLLAYNLPGIIGVGIDQLPSQPRCTAASTSPTTCFRPTQDGYPANILNPALTSTLASRTNFIPADTRTGYTMNWHFTLQRELGRNFVLDLAYVANRSNKLVILSDYNEARFNNAGENLTVNARRPVAGFGQIQISQPAGFSNYHALQAKIERRFSNGFLFLNTFVWSKAIDNASGHLETSGGDDSRVSFTQRRSYKGVSGYNQPLNNTMTVIWEVPFGKGKRFGSGMPLLADVVLGGWNLSQTTTANSGLPVNLVYSPVARLQVGSIGNVRANVVGNPVLADSARTIRELYLDRNAVLEVANNNAAVANPYGNVGRNIVTSPSYFGTDLGVHKRFRIREGMNLELRAEFFNLFNKTNLLAPDSNRSSQTFGLINGSFAARQGQIALKLMF